MTNQTEKKHLLQLTKSVWMFIFPDFSYWVIPYTWKWWHFSPLCCISKVPRGGFMNAQNKCLQFPILIYNMSCHTKVIVTNRGPVIPNQSQILFYLPFVIIKLLDFLSTLSFRMAVCNLLQQKQSAAPLVSPYLLPRRVLYSPQHSSCQWIGQFVQHGLQHFVSESKPWHVLECWLAALLACSSNVIIFTG